MTKCGRLASIARGVRIATLMSERTNSCRLVGSDLSTRHRFWSDYGQPGSNPQVPINAVTGHLGTGTFCGKNWPDNDLLRTKEPIGRST